MASLLDTLRQIADSQPAVSREYEKNEINEIMPSQREPMARSPVLGAADLRPLYHSMASPLRGWNAAAAIWHRQHGERVPGHLCAGCGTPLDGGADVLLLPHGERAHAGGGYMCVIAYARRWKREAAMALTAIGIPTPPEIVAEITERDP